MEQIRYLGTDLVDQISMQEETMGKLMSENVCCHSEQNFCLSFEIQKYKA